MAVPKTDGSVLAKIIRILGVRDTRDRIEVGDRWVAVPGTGDLRPCDRCCREHEIHVDVELSDGRRANIGSGCAKGESMEIQARLKSAVSAAKTRSKGVDDASVLTVPGSARGFDAERRQALISTWRGNRYRERGFETLPYSYKRRGEDLADRIAKIENKLGSLLF